MTAYTMNHNGLDRVINGTDVLVHQVGPVRGMKMLPVVVLSGMVAAVLAIAERVFSNLSTDSFAVEWLVFWGVSVLAVLLLTKTAFGLARWMVRSEHGLVRHWKRAEAEREFQRIVSVDYRMADELRVARAHAEALID